MKRFFYCWWVLLALLCSCLGPMDSGPTLGESSQRFSEAMRWRDYVGAALFIAPPAQQDFYASFPQDDDDLRVVGSRIESIKVNEDGKTAVAVYLLEYYRLPSSRIKKWRWTQEWQQYHEKITKPGIWLIQNPPPPVP